MEYWDYTDNMVSKEKQEELNKMSVKLIPITNELAKEIFKDFINDRAMFKDGEFKPFIYNEDDYNNYVENAKLKNKINYAIIYNDIPVGEVRFKHFINDSAELGIVIKNDSYKNKGIGTKAIREACIIAKEELKLNKLRARILKDNTRSQVVFLKNLFDLYGNMDDFIILVKEL